MTLLILLISQWSLQLYCNRSKINNVITIKSQSSKQNQAHEVLAAILRELASKLLAVQIGKVD